jgi:two-component system response regulator HydG
MVDVRTVLVVDDDADLCASLAEALEARGYRAETTTSGSEATQLARSRDYGAILLDIELGAGVTGLEVCREIVAITPDLPIIIVTGHDDLDNVVQAIRAGAFEFIRKPVSLDSLDEVVGRALRARGRRQPPLIEDGSEHAPRPPYIIGDSAAMRRLYADIIRVSRADTTVVVTGETGTGKELVARAIHESSPRSEQAFVALNCAAMTSTLLESELFGHVKGAFTDARRRRDGLFVAADGGTLFLDEIGEMGLDMQAKLLRVLQNRRVRAVGGTVEVPVDVRLIAATNRDLEAEVARGTFREDVFYRIHVVALEVPPLRERDDDVVLIARHLLEQAFPEHDVRLAPDVERKLHEYDWPGNVRELENVITRASAVLAGDVVEVEHLPPQVRDHVPKSSVINGFNSSALPTLDEVEQRYISHVLEIVDGNKTSASKILGMNRRTLYRKLARYSESAG